VDVDNDLKGGDGFESEDVIEFNWFSSPILRAALDSFCHNEGMDRFELFSVSLSGLDLMTKEDKHWSDSLTDELVVTSCTVHQINQILVFCTFINCGNLCLKKDLMTR
jgi:hypothetical protein